MFYEIDDQPYERWLWKFYNKDTNQEWIEPRYLTEQEAKIFARACIIEILNKIEDSKIKIRKEDEGFGIDYPLKNIQLELI